MNPTGGSMMESLGAGEARRVKMIRRPRRAAARLVWFGRGFLAWRTKWGGIDVCSLGPGRRHYTSGLSEKPSSSFDPVWHGPCRLRSRVSRPRTGQMKVTPLDDVNDARGDRTS